MKLIDVLRKPRYALASFLSSTAMFWAYAYAQNLGIIENIPFWLTIITPENAILLFLFTTLFGFWVAFFWYGLREKSCEIPITKGGLAGSGASLGGFIVAQCAGCLSLITLLLPLSASILLLKYNTILNVLSVLLLTAALWHMGAFRK